MGMNGCCGFNVKKNDINLCRYPTRPPSFLTSFSACLSDGMMAGGLPMLSSSVVSVGFFLVRKKISTRAGFKRKGRRRKKTCEEAITLGLPLSNCFESLSALLIVVVCCSGARAVHKKFFC